MDTRNIVKRYKDGSLDAVIINVRSNEAFEEFYSKYTMEEICYGIVKTVKEKFKHELKRFTVECTSISEGFVYVLFKYSEIGLDDLLKAELYGVVFETVEQFGFKVKIQYLEDKNGKE